jgi:hypothetical protein
LKDFHGVLTGVPVFRDGTGEMISPSDGKK